jgi:hypothetical protein
LRFAELVRSERERDSGEQREREREIEKERGQVLRGIEKID